MVDQETCESGVPTQDGSKSSKSKENSWLTQPTIRLSKLNPQRMKKVIKLLSTIETETPRTMPTKDGRLSMLTKLRLSGPRASTRSSDSTSTDHSTSDQECQCKELLSATVPTMSGSRDGERMSEPSNGTSMRCPRLSRITTGSPTHLISKATEDQATSDVPQPTQDGGRCSDTKELLLETRKER
jgi:hypothetical protein